MSEIPYMMANTQAEFERVRDLAWPRTPAPDLSPAEAARVAAFDAAPTPPEVVVETVARAIGEEWCTPLPWDELSLATQNECRRLAAAAIAADPSPAEEAVKRVEALLARWEDETREWYYANRYTHENGIEYVAGYEDGWNFADEQIRAALASPAPASQGEEGIVWAKHVDSCRVFYAERRCTCGATA